MRPLVLLAMISLLVLACESINISISLANPTPTVIPVTPTVPATTTTQATAIPTIDVRATVTTQAQTMATMQAQMAATAQAEMMATVQAESTMQAQATISARATGTAQAVAATRARATEVARAAEMIVAGWRASAKIANTLPNGILSGSAGNTTMDTLDAHVNLRNLIIEVKFVNPYGGIAEWDYGVGFRDIGRNNQYRLYIDHQGQWYLVLGSGEINADGTAKTKTVSSGVYGKIKLAPGDYNFLRLAVKDTRGYFFINGDFIAELDVSEKNVSGEVYVSTGFRTGHDNPNLSVLFRDFDVYSLP